MRHYIGLKNSETVDYQGDWYLIVGYLGEKMLISNPTETVWVEIEDVRYYGAQSKPSIPYGPGM